MHIETGVHFFFMGNCKRHALMVDSMKKSSIASAVVVLSLIIVCVVSVAGSRLGSNEYGRMIAVTALYEEPVTQPRYERISYEDMENRLVSSAVIKTDNPTTPVLDDTDTSSTGDELADKNKAALLAIVAADKNSKTTKASLAENRQDQYQLNEIKEIDTSTASASILTGPGTTYVLPQGNAAVATPVLATPGQTGTYAGQFVLTGYCPCAICCGKTNGITACGTLATANHTIAADSRFSFGTKMVINGVVYTVEDRGGAIKGNRIDIFFTTHQDALNFGRQTGDVYIIE